MDPLPTLYSWDDDPVVRRERAPAAPPVTSDVAPAATSAWELKRDPPRPHDTKLSQLATQWLAELPDALRPALLGLHFPRVTNRIALCWKDPALAGLLIEELLVHRRPGRRGFPVAVQAELRLLATDVRARMPLTGRR